MTSPIRLYAPSDLHGDPSRWWSQLCPYPGNPHWDWKEGWRWKVYFVQDITTCQRRVVRAKVCDRDDGLLVDVVFTTKSHFVPNEAYSRVSGDVHPYAEFDGDLWVGPPCAKQFMVGGQVIEPAPRAGDKSDQILAILRNLDRNQTIVVGWVKDLTKVQKELDDRNRMLRDVLKEVAESEAELVRSEATGRIGSFALGDVQRMLGRIKVAAEVPF